MAPESHAAVDGPAILVLGMHRSGTSCLAALLAAAGARVPGESLRNWDNPKGHHEATALVRLNDDVLAHSGGHWLEAPEQIRWTPAQAAERDRLLTERPDGRPALLKDPRSLLTLPFWQATAVPFRAVGIVRHPLSVARSLLAWRQMPMDEGLALWQAHNLALETAGCDRLDFDRPAEEFLAAVVAWTGRHGLGTDAATIAAAYRAELIHHAPGDGPQGSTALLATCTALHARLTGHGGDTAAAEALPVFPWDAVAAVRDALPKRQDADVLTHARRALDQARDPAAAIAPIAADCLRAHRGDLLTALLTAEVRLSPGLRHLLLGKAALDQGDAPRAVAHLTQACAQAEPLYEARHLLPTALHAAGRSADADAAVAALLPVALYPFRLHARRAEWAWARGEHAAALNHLAAAVAAAPPWRQGRLLHRRAAWRTSLGDPAGAAEDRHQAALVDPTWTAR